MDPSWRDETKRTTDSFDRVADLYRREFVNELDDKPFDREFLAQLASRLRDGAPVLEVGAGFGHVGAVLAANGVRVLASDASTGQLREARAFDATRPILAADLARLPMRDGSLGGVLAYYCLIYGPPDHLDAVFADWHRALAPGGLAIAAVHKGGGTIPMGPEWHGRAIDVTIVLRDPADLSARFERSGFAVEQCTVRPPYPEEHATHRCHVVARKKS